jgi:transposase
MPRYKPVSYEQNIMVPISLEAQIVRGTLEFAIHHLIESRVNLSLFGAKIKNDETGRPAYNPKILLKIILFAYSRGIISSRKIEKACKENIIFIALSGWSEPDHTTIANFVSSMKGKTFISDSNYHSEDNLKKCSDEKLNAYIPDVNFRKREPRFKTADRHKPEKEKKYTKEEFQHDKERDVYICPNRKELKLDNKRARIKDYIGRKYVSMQKDCTDCRLRDKCLRKEDTKRRYLVIPIEKYDEQNFSKEMVNKIDTEEGRQIYSERMKIVEPVFANIRVQKRLDRFTLRGKIKVNIQWLLYCIVHNIGKIAYYGMQSA